jgi:hypothetical protein
MGFASIILTMPAICRMSEIERPMCTKWYAHARKRAAEKLIRPYTNPPGIISLQLADLSATAKSLRK